jgi:hypothetical protein
MPSSLRASGAPRWAWAVVWVSVGVAAATTATEVVQQLDPPRAQTLPLPLVRPERHAPPTVKAQQRTGLPKDWMAILDDALVRKLREEAKVFAAAPDTTPRQGLAKFAAAEDSRRPW